MFRKYLVLIALCVGGIPSGDANETFIGSFAEPLDGGNIDTALSTYDGSTVTIIPRSHSSEAIGGAARWRNVLFAIRGMKGRNPSFVLPHFSPSSRKMILSGDAKTAESIELVWSYLPNAVKWTKFDHYTRSGTDLTTRKATARNDFVFSQDVVYVSINERYPVTDFYDWLETQVFSHPLVRPTPSEAKPGTFVIGYQSGAPASAIISRSIPDTPLFGFVIRDPAASNTKLVMLVSGQHPYEGQNKVALQAAVEWILHSSSDAAKAYRANYTTVVYPFVNPTGELAGLWRGTAYAPFKDTNRNWHTEETVPARNRGVDTVVVHKNAMSRDIAELGLGEPYAVFDYHQNYGDRPGMPDYVMHSSASNLPDGPAARRAAATDYRSYFARISALTSLGDVPSDLTTRETLRGYMVGRGATLPLTFERSVYNTIASEWSFGIATVQALVGATDDTALTVSDRGSLAQRAGPVSEISEHRIRQAGSPNDLPPASAASEGSVSSTQSAEPDLVLTGSPAPAI